MGLFSQKPRIPDPYISVTFDEHCQGRPFYPGSKISGYIEVQSPVPRNLEWAHVCLLGHVATHSRKSQGTGPSSTTVYFRDDASLFLHAQDLWTSTSLQPDQALTYGFPFHFPHSSGVVGCKPYTGRTASSQMYATDAHPLPPSFALMRTSHEYALVEYKLQVTSRFNDSTDPVVVDFEPLNFIPHMRRPQNPPLSEFVKRSEKYSSSRLIGGPKSPSHSFRDKFSLQTPWVNLTMKASAAPYVAISSSFPIYACIELDSFSHPEIDVRIVNLKIKSLKLYQCTFYRSKHRSREHEATADESVPLNVVPEWRQVDRQQGKTNERSFVYFPAAFEARIPSSTCSSFQTFNVNHSSQLEFKLEAELCEKKFEFKVEVPNFVICPS